MKIFILILIILNSTYSFKLDQLAYNLASPKISLSDCHKDLNKYRQNEAKKELVTSELTVGSILNFVRAVTKSRHVNFKPKENEKLIKCIESRDKGNMCLNEINNKIKQCRFVAYSNDILVQYVKYTREIKNKSYPRFDHNNELSGFFKNFTNDYDSIMTLYKYLDNGVKKDLKIRRISPINIINVLIFSVNHNFSVFNWLNYSDLFSCIMIREPNCLEKWKEIIEFRSQLFYLLEEVYYYFYKKNTILI